VCCVDVDVWMWIRGRQRGGLNPWRPDEKGIVGGWVDDDDDASDVTCWEWEWEGGAVT
jgi:hypothetical protein